jgi:hypothetical protein
MSIFDSNIERRIQTPTDAEWHHIRDTVDEEYAECDRIHKRARKLF